MNLPAKRIESGSWSARWGDHVVALQQRPSGWRATVWLWNLENGLAGRVLLDTSDGLPSAKVAAQWACGILAAYGGSVFIDGEHRDIEAYLSFAPAPTLIA